MQPAGNMWLQSLNTIALLLIFLSAIAPQAIVAPDPPVIGNGQAAQPLTSWMLINGDATIAVRGNVPGDIITDLAEGGVIPLEPFFGTNWRQASPS